MSTGGHDHEGGTEATPRWVRAAMAQREPTEEMGGQHRASREQQVLDRIERARKRKPRVREERITLAHGSGGKATRTLIDAVFVEGFRNPILEKLSDGAELAIGESRLALTTDSFVVSPLFFSGGDIGDLAINGTVNDLSVSGATPLYLSAGFVIEEGFPVADLRRIVTSMSEAARAAGVQVVTGDTKVVDKGKADGCYITTAGVGVLETEHELGFEAVRPGDAILVSGPIGDHGVTILLARGELDIDADVVSDTAPLNGMLGELLATTPGVRAMRDPTRGGVATVLNEIATASELAIRVSEDAVPVRQQVRGASELLGIDPLYVACEGRAVVVVDPGETEEALRALGEQAAVIGHVEPEPSGMVLLNTSIGGTRIVDLLVGDPLPRIC